MCSREIPQPEILYSPIVRQDYKIAIMSI
jgi:hypothetical protein